MLNSEWFALELRGSPDSLWSYTVCSTSTRIDVTAPSFEIDGQTVHAALSEIALYGEPLRLPNGATETRFRGCVCGQPNLELQMVFQTEASSPVVRFRYVLTSCTPVHLTRNKQEDGLSYLEIPLAGMPTRTEICLSEFDESIHSFRLTERPIPDRAFEHGLSVFGPILVAQGPRDAVLVAYEHGSQVPDAFLRFRLQPDQRICLEAVKGNYSTGQTIDADHPFESVWFELAAVPGTIDKLASAYRRFVLTRMSQNRETRQPYIFYNTWAYQERNKWWNGATFLASMHQERMLAEIDIAHRMGIEVFVLDTGWYAKTGDWRVSLERFPDGLREIRERLNRYGMKLGLWFSPRQAAVSSRILQDHQDCLMSWNGHPGAPHPVWETEDSQELCLVSRYWEAFADELIRLHHELGVTYFKWDAIHQYGCNDPGHWHGTEANTPQERADCYAFELVRYMARIVDRVCAACPDAIVDFDITEGQRAVGLAFLAAGKYFLINNGPYYQSLDDPQYAPGGGMGANVFVFPGPARARLCRAPLDYDRWIPSVLFLTHYLPDDPEASQMINLASLVLGQNGIWGDLLNVSEAGITLFHRVLSLYRQLRDDITLADPVRTGIVGGSPEVHEKINSESGRGVVALFAGNTGSYSTITAHRVAPTYWASPGVSVAIDARGHARITAELSNHSAALVFFGVESE